MEASLVCPDCASEHPGGERFCPHCGMPLVPGDEDAGPVDERRRRARKIKPEYAQGALVRVTWARNQAEAELLAGMLLEEGIPSLLRRQPGFDVPDFMAAGPRILLVPQSGLAAAREMLLQGEGAPPPRPRTPPSARTRALAAVLLAITLLTIVLFMATHVWD